MRKKSRLVRISDDLYFTLEERKRDYERLKRDHNLKGKITIVKTSELVAEEMKRLKKKRGGFDGWLY